MPRRRIPTARAAVSGASAKNPQRFRDRPKRDLAKLGKAPKGFTALQIEHWSEFARIAPWLRESDRITVTLAVKLAAKMDEPEGLSISGMQVLSALLSKLGMTPTDESKVTRPEEEPEDPAERFFRTH